MKYTIYIYRASTRSISVNKIKKLKSEVIKNGKIKRFL
jgi:hypothetical protein